MALYMSKRYAEADTLYSNLWVVGECQSALFIYVLYLNEFFKSGETSEGKGLFFFKSFLQSYYEDMFFRGVTETPMLAPDGKVTSISIVDLRALINKLPDMP